MAEENEGQKARRGPGILEQAREIMEERGAEYGDIRESMWNIARVWSIILGREVEPREVALCMAGLKLVREANRHKTDNLVDIINYVRAAEIVQSEDGVDGWREEWTEPEMGRDHSPLEELTSSGRWDRADEEVVKAVVEAERRMDEPGRCFEIPRLGTIMLKDGVAFGYSDGKGGVVTFSTIPLESVWRENIVPTDPPVVLDRRVVEGVGGIVEGK